jgi:hypothetical protein
MSDPKDTGSRGARLLIAIYAAAIVLLGWHPLKKDYARDFYRAKAAVKNYLEEAPPHRGTMPPAATRRQSPPLDSMRAEDRKELQGVIDTIP